MAILGHLLLGNRLLLGKRWFAFAACRLSCAGNTISTDTASKPKLATRAQRPKEKEAKEGVMRLNNTANSKNESRSLHIKKSRARSTTCATLFKLNKYI